MSQQNQSQNQSNSGGMFSDPIILWPLVIGIVAAYVIYVKPEWIAVPWSWSVRFNATLLGLVVMDEVRLAEIDKIIAWLKTVDMKSISDEQFDYVNSVVGNSVKYLYPILISTMLFLIYRRRKKYTFSLFTLEELIKQESVVWPHLKFLIKHNPLKQSWSKGDFAFRQSPSDWSKENRVLMLDTDKRAVINYDKTHQLYISQLGARIKSKEDILSLPLAYKIILLICNVRYEKGLNGGGKKPTFMAQKLINPIKKALSIPVLITEDDWLFFYGDYFSMPDKQMEKSESWFISIVDEELKSHLKGALFTYCFNHHAYAATYLLECLTKAREYGIMPCAWFPYLTVMDRNVNYLVDDCGRSTYSIVIAGAIAHFKAEKKSGRRLVSPFVKTVQLSYALHQRGVLDHTD